MRKRFFPYAWGDWVAMAAVVAVILNFANTASSQHGPEVRTGCASHHYRIVPLPLRPYHVNDQTAVAGVTADHRAASWTEKGGPHVFELPTGFHHAEAIDINNAGHVLVTAASADGAKRASFLAVDGPLQPIRGENARANAINTRGELAGEAKFPGQGGTGPAWWRSAEPTSLGACCGGRAIALNDRGDVVGEAYDKQGQYRAFAWNQKAGLALIGPEDAYSTAVAVNDFGHVVVYAFTTGSWFYRDGKSTKMDLSKRWPSQPRALNGCDVVVGSFGANSDESEAFVWDEKEGFRNLNDLVAKNTGWKLEVASSVNERGEIAGWGDHGGDEDAGFLLIPEKP